MPSNFDELQSMASRQERKTTYRKTKKMTNESDFVMVDKEEEPVKSSAEQRRETKKEPIVNEG